MKLPLPLFIKLNFFHLVSTKNTLNSENDRIHRFTSHYVSTLYQERIIKMRTETTHENASVYL